MKAKYINPFYQATNDVLNNMLELNTERGQLDVIEDIVPGNEANVIIGITGDLSGSILYSFSKDMTLEIVKMMSGMEMEELDSFVTSALGEVANIISGNAVTYLKNENYNCDIVPPQVIIGQNKSLSMATEKALLLPVKTDIGKFDLNISVKEAIEQKPLN
ncbi:chemotaxis protein CheX [Natranaerobius thermophilus]|uniref:CheC domain protein n=1 Tax=Natranaerobius thermophilus (strain ATCC BAA-1301 / DSM 18059 / JW/NM-WN-LF) TaxID=457570 RepID=B2A6U8_NATTJ|nr:chemotaxis protein CheX [Natranaerobius thermophilus]ACB84229.1 CheC domain protein [Natranaerobius thermophilus JW/NM-WN-LF]